MGYGSLAAVVVSMGTRRLGRTYYETEKSKVRYQNKGIDVYSNTIHGMTPGVCGRLDGAIGRSLIHLQASYMGLVADGGPDS